MTASNETGPALRRELREAYTARIDRVLDFVEQHIECDLDLEQLARVAGFSRFHFHRIFRAMRGETVNQFVHRVRVERAAALLIRDPASTVTDIAHSCGFHSSASFARAFKQAFGMTATQWRRGGSRSYKQPRPVADVGGGSGILSHRLDPVSRRPSWRIHVEGKDPAPVVIEDVPEQTVAYVRHTGRYQGQSAVFADLFDRLTRWAEPRGLLRDPDAELLAVYHDSPRITDDDKLRVSVCVSVPAGTVVRGEVGRMVLAGGTSAVGSFRVGVGEYHLAWQALLGGWLPESGYQLDDRLCYERYRVGDHDASLGQTAVDICIPVRPF